MFSEAAKHNPLLCQPISSLLKMVSEEAKYNTLVSELFSKKKPVHWKMFSEKQNPAV